MEFKLTKIDAAIDQLDWAIRLFLDHQAYVPAITLAGAAEEILGKAVGERSTFYQLKQKFVADLSMAEKHVSQNHLNIAKNFLKHWDEKSDQEKICLELDSEAIQYIVRALTNLANYFSSQPSEAPRLWAWLVTNRPDLIDE
jgi:hypothetical protein